MKRYDFRDKTVLVTGASMGIGASFARELHRRGARLILTARSRDKLERLASEVGGAEVMVEDLALPGAAKRLHGQVEARGLQVDVLINNAGFARFGPFTELSLEDQRGQVALNVTALVELTHLLLPAIAARAGGIVHVASTAAFQPVPYLAVYAATKAFVLSFGEALWAEHRARGVRVTTVCPGATDTPFFARAGEAAALGKKARPEDVVRVALAAFDAGRPSVVHGAMNRFNALLSRIFTRAFTVKVSGRLMRPRELGA